MNKAIYVVILAALSTAAHANLIRNSGFEMVPSALMGQGLLPSEWTRVNSTPDTYSNDGSYGLPPEGFGNFPGETAYEGIRWIAGWSQSDEQFGQTLSNSLTAGDTYSFSGHMLQSSRFDLNHPGGYELYLTSDASGDLSSGVLLGSIGTTSAGIGWDLYTLTFVAPDNADNLGFLLFKPFGDVTGSAYPGLDAVSLTAVPLPAAVWLLGSGLLGLASLRRARKA